MKLQNLTAHLQSDADYDIVEVCGNSFLCFWKCQRDAKSNESNHR